MDTMNTAQSALAAILAIGTANIDISCDRGGDGAKIIFPAKSAKTGYTNGIWDVGPAFVAGQPTEEALRDLAKEGVRTVVCVRGTEEMSDRGTVPFDEAALLKELGVKYVHIPMGSIDEYNSSVVKRFAEAMNAADTKILLHCTVAWRASYVWTAYLFKYRGLSLDEAIRNGRGIGLDPDRVGQILGEEVSYSARPRTGEKRGPKAGMLSKSGSRVLVHEPQVVSAIDNGNYYGFVMWDLGTVLNSSQPDEMKLRELAASGVKTVINIRTEAEMEQVKKDGFDEEAVAKSLGLNYVRLPIVASEFSPVFLAKLSKAIEGSSGKILLHCNTATRTSYLWAAYINKYQGVELSEAMRHMYAMRIVDHLSNMIDMDISYKIKPKAAPNPCGGG